MITFSSTIKLMILVSLANILSVGYCTADNFEVNCIIAPGGNAKGIESRKPSLVNKCAKGYENKTIIDKCESLIAREPSPQRALFLPVMSNKNNKTYLNQYCAACNNDTESEEITFESWPLYPLETCQKLSERIQRSEISDIYNLTQILVNEGAKLTTNQSTRLGSTQWDCSVNGKWPIRLLDRVISCLYFELDSGMRFRLNRCQYAEQTGRICARMKLYQIARDFYFRDMKKIDKTVPLSEYKGFDSGQYYQETEYPGVYFICDITGPFYGGNHFIKISVVVISLIFIFIILGLTSNKPYFQQNSTNKLLYLYMVGLVPMTLILSLIYLSHPVPSVAYYLAKFFWVYHFFWSVLLFIEFCLMTFGALKNRISDVRYLVYFIFGFLVPFAMPIIYYFGVLIVNDNYKGDLSQIPPTEPFDWDYTCPIIPNHTGVFSTASKTFGSKYYEGWLKIFLFPSFFFFMPAMVSFIMVAAVWYLAKFNSSDAQSIRNKESLYVIMKMTLITGVHWLLFLYNQKYGYVYSTGEFGALVDTLSQLSVDFHGVIVFIVLGYYKTCIGRTMKIFGCEYKSVTQNDRNNVEI